jgi:hypothetical protein
LWICCWPAVVYMAMAIPSWLPVVKILCILWN